MPKAERKSESRTRCVGFVGCPPEETIAPYRGGKLIDLDNRQPGVSESEFDQVLPATTCRIIKRILSNALALEPEVIVLDDGYSKCDNARFLGEVLEDLLGDNTTVVRTRNDNTLGRGTPISDCGLPLAEKVSLILDDYVSPVQKANLPPCNKPPAAFWGVPCADESIYGLFPEGTQVLGWLRCFENRTPSDLELECRAPGDVPTVFFAQTFCSKNILAKHLARRHNGLYLDADGTLSRSERAKIEAFLHFRREGH